MKQLAVETAPLGLAHATRWIASAGRCSRSKPIGRACGTCTACIAPNGVTGDSALADELRQHVKERLAVYEHPRWIVFARELPTTTSGKIRRVELRREGADERYGVGGDGRAM